MIEEVMFKVEFIVRAKDLGPMLVSLSGKVMELKQTPIVVGVSGGNGADVGNLPEAFVNYLRKHKMPMISAATVKDYLKSVGRPPTSHGYVLKQLLAAGVLTRVGKGTGMKYRVKK